MRALVNILVFTSDSDSTLEEEEAYLIFVIFLHRQNFWRMKFTLKYTVNYCVLLCITQ